MEKTNLPRFGDPVYSAVRCHHGILHFASMVGCISQEHETLLAAMIRDTLAHCDSPAERKFLNACLDYIRDVENEEGA